MLILAILMGAAAFFLGWAIGPLGLKLANSLKSSADKSQAEAKAGKDYELPFHEMITPEYIDVHHFAGLQREPYYIFIPLILALIFNNHFFWTLFIVVLLSLFWKEVVVEIFHILGFLWSFVFPAPEKKKK